MKMNVRVFWVVVASVTTCKIYGDLNDGVKPVVLFVPMFLLKNALPA
jgi:hypothetical protein